MGRDHELHEARDFLRTNRAPETPLPSVLTISGEPGVGKSRLLDRLVRLAVADGTVVLVGQCKAEFGEGFEGFRGILAHLISLEDEPIHPSPCTPTSATAVSGLRNTSAKTAITGVDAQAQPVDTMTSGSRPVAAQAPPEQSDIETIDSVSVLPASFLQPGSREKIPGLSIPSEADPEFQILKHSPRDASERIRHQELRQTLVMSRITSRLLCLALRLPVLVIIEDFQWADTSTVSLLEYILRSHGIATLSGYTGRIQFVISHRLRADTGALERLNNMLASLTRFKCTARRICVSPLSCDTAVVLTADLLMEPANDRLKGFCQAIFRGGDATPLHVEQSIRILLHRGLLTKDQAGSDGLWNGVWNLDADLAVSANLPKTVQEAIGEHAARLAVNTQHLLAIASLVGRKFAVELLAEAGSKHVNEVLDSLDEAVATGLVAEVDETLEAKNRYFRFTHDRFRESIVQRLQDAQAQDLHKTLASSIVRLYGENQDTVPALARHFQHAKEYESAFRCAVKAAQGARDAGAFGRAVEFYRHALDAGAAGRFDFDPTMHADYADVCVGNGLFDVADEHYGIRLASLPDAGFERWNILRRKAELNNRRVQHDKAAAPLEQALAEMGYPLHHSGWRLALSTFTGIVVLLFGVLVPGVIRGKPAKNRKLATTVSRCFFALAESLTLVDSKRAVYVGTRCVLHSIRAGTHDFTAAVYASSAYAAASMGIDWLSIKYAKLSEENISEAEPYCAAVTYWLLVGAAIFRGDFDKAFQYVGPSVQAAEQSGDISRRALSYMFYNSILTQTGRINSAAVVANQLGIIAERYDVDMLRVYKKFGGALHQMIVGDQDPKDLLNDLDTQLLEMGDELTHLFNRAAYALLCAFAHQGDPEERILECVNLAQRWIDKHFALPTTAHLSVCLAAISVSLRQQDTFSQQTINKIVAVRRSVKSACFANRLETPLYLAASAAIDGCLEIPAVCVTVLPGR